MRRLGAFFGLMLVLTLAFAVGAAAASVGETASLLVVSIDRPAEGGLVLVDPRGGVCSEGVTTIPDAVMYVSSDDGVNESENLTTDFVTVEISDAVPGIYTAHARARNLRDAGILTVNSFAAEHPCGEGVEGVWARYRGHGAVVYRFSLSVEEDGTCSVTSVRQ